MNTVRIGRRELLGLLPALACAAPAAAALRLPDGQRSVSLPFELIDNRLFVEASVNGRGPFRFVFDTGGANILDRAVAEGLGLPLGGGFSMPGAGAGTLPAWRTQVAQAQVGALRMSDLPFAVLPLEALRRAIGFAQLDGLIGHEVLRRFVVRLDFVGRRVTLDEPESDAGPPTGATTLPIEFIGNLPHVAGWIDGLPGRLVIDSGDRSSLTLFTPFVDDHRLREAYPRRFAALTGWGVGGPLHADVTRVRELLLGPLAVRGVTARMPTGRGGAFAMRAVQASAGTGVLKRLEVGFDHGRRRLWLAPNAHHERPDPVDHSGLWLAQGEGAFVVEHVSAHTAAHAAGLRPGDRVLAVDGRPASAWALPDLRQRWAEHGPGLAVTLTVDSAGGASGTPRVRERRFVFEDRFAAAR
jgi:hypothetical protein